MESAGSSTFSDLLHSQSVRSECDVSDEVLANDSLAAIGHSAMAQNVIVQNQAHFRAALEKMSRSPSFILITVVDGRSGARRTGCTMAGFLLHSIAEEEGVDRTEYHGSVFVTTIACAQWQLIATARESGTQ